METTAFIYQARMQQVFIANCQVVYLKKKDFSNKKTEPIRNGIFAL